MSYVPDQAALAIDLFDASPLPSFIVSLPRFTILRISFSARKLTRYAAEEHKCISFCELFHEQEAIVLKQLLEARTPFKFLASLYRKDSGPVKVEITGQPIGAEMEDCFYITLTDQTELLNKLEGYQHYMEQSSEAVWRYELKKPVSILAPAVEIIKHIKDHAYLAECNERFARMYGFATVDEIIHTKLELIYDFSIPQNIEFLKTFIENNFLWIDAERKHITPDGSTVYFISNLIGIIQNGHFMGGWGNQRDITERKKMELALRESEDRFRELANSAPAMIWICDENNRTTYVNKSWIEFTGVDLTDKGTAEWASIIHPDDRCKTIETCRSAANQEKSVTVTYRLLDKTGDYQWVVDTSTPRYAKNGRFIGYIGSVINITQQKTQEEQLRYQSTLFDNVSDIIVTTDLDFIIRSWNKVAENYYGLKKDQVIGKKISTLLSFSYPHQSQSDALDKLINEGKWVGEVEFSSSNGEKKTFLQTVTYVYDNDQNKIGVMAMGRDITELKKVEERLEQSELFYKNLIKDSLDGILLTDVHSTITFVSPSIQNILGYKPGEILGKNCFSFVHQQDLEWAINSFQKEVESKAEVKSISIRLQHKNGNWVWCMVRGHNLLNNPYISSIVLYIHDDTLRKKAKDALMRSEKQFRELISELQVGILMMEKNGKVILCNKTSLNILGATEEEIMGKIPTEYLIDVIHENGRRYEAHEFALATVLRTQRTVKNKVMGIWRATTNSRVWIWVNAEPVFAENGEISSIVCSFADITERKTLEQKLIADEVNHQRQLTQATIDGQERERREIGKELHDNIGQQLTTTKLYLDLAKSTADDNTNELISLALKGISDVINEIRSISHSLVPPSLGDLGLQESLSELTDSVRRAQLLKIKLDFYEIDEARMADNKKLMIYRIVQEQLNNIVKHANASEVYINIINDEQHYLVEVKDNGNGFDIQTIRKGLGLTNIRSRAALFGGRVQINSAPGKGCHLKVILPHQGQNIIEIPH